MAPAPKRAPPLPPRIPERRKPSLLPPEVPTRHPARLKQRPKPTTTLESVVLGSLRSEVELDEKTPKALSQVLPFYQSRAVPTRKDSLETFRTTITELKASRDPSHRSLASWYLAQECMEYCYPSLAPPKLFHRYMKLAPAQHLESKIRKARTMTSIRDGTVQTLRDRKKGLAVRHGNRRAKTDNSGDTSFATRSASGIENSSPIMRKEVRSLKFRLKN